MKRQIFQNKRSVGVQTRRVLGATDKIGIIHSNKQI